jgi:hypothetical protein
MQATERQPSDLGAATAALGVASALLLAASLRWAHHWGPLAFIVIAGWAGASAGACATTLVSMSRGHRRLRLVRLGMAMVGVSLAALMLAGIVWAGGGDPSMGCGGG